MMYKELVETYFEAWTANGIDPAYADIGAIRGWLSDEDIWTETDRRILGGMGRVDIVRLSHDISKRVREELGLTIEAEVERAKAYHETMDYLYTIATETNNSDIFEAYSRMARAEGDLFSPAVYFDPAVVRPEDDPSDLDPWVLTTEAWHDSEGAFAAAYTEDHALLLDPSGCLSCFSGRDFLAENMLWSLEPNELPEHLNPLYDDLKKEAR